MAIERDEEREIRIQNEITVDTYGSLEVAMGWYCYLDEQISMPFIARCIQKRNVSPLKLGESVEVVDIADSNDCESNILVIIELFGRKFGVPLEQLQAVDADETTVQAIEDWHYWKSRNYSF